MWINHVENRPNPPFYGGIGVEKMFINANDIHIGKVKGNDGRT